MLSLACFHICDNHVPELQGIQCSLFGGVGQLVLPASVVALLYSPIVPQTLDGRREALVQLLHLVHLHLQH